MPGRALDWAPSSITAMPRSAATTELLEGCDLAVEVDGDDRPCPLGESLVDTSRVDQERVVVDVDEDRAGARAHDRLGGRDERVRGQDDLVPVADAVARRAISSASVPLRRRRRSARPRTRRTPARKPPRPCRRRSRRGQDLGETLLHLLGDVPCCTDRSTSGIACTCGLLGSGRGRMGGVTSRTPDRRRDERPDHRGLLLLGHGVEERQDQGVVGQPLGDGQVAVRVIRVGGLAVRGHDPGTSGDHPRRQRGEQLVPAQRVVVAELDPERLEVRLTPGRVAHRAQTRDVGEHSW